MDVERLRSCSERQWTRDGKLAAESPHAARGVAIMPLKPRTHAVVDQLSRGAGSQRRSGTVSGPQPLALSRCKKDLQ